MLQSPIIGAYLLLFHTLVFLFFSSCKHEINQVIEVDRLPGIFPDYTEITVPPNIAPLNFRINEPGIEYEVKFSSGNLQPLIINCTDPIIKIKENKWHELLRIAAGSEYSVQILVKNYLGEWRKFREIKNKVSTEKIDRYLVYRQINTGYVLWTNLGIYQRNLENFDEQPVLENRSIGYACLNCHSFCKNDPDKMMLHIRKNFGGTVIYKDGKIEKVDLKTRFTLSAGVYPSWHPGGKYIAFSVNKINQFFYSGDIRIEVSDEYSDLMVYNTENHTILTSAKISTSNRENLPAWSPDGKYLYFISAPPSKSPDTRIYAKYDLLRVEFEADSGRFGNVDTVLSSSLTHKSITFPKVSPDGKFLMFTMTDHGYFSIHHPMADLYLLKLEDGSYEKMEINSPHTESYHSFSSSGKWFVFSSKRMDGLLTRPFFSLLDSLGKASKPFVLPQENPEYYLSFNKNYNVPEMITDEIKVTQIELRDLILNDPVKVNIHSTVDTAYLSHHLKNPFAN